MIYDCVIVGAGPGGLSAAIYLGRAHKETLLVYQGYRRTSLAKHIQNYLGFEDITGPELINKGLRQAELYKVETLVATTTKVSFRKGFFSIETSKKNITARSVVVAPGIDDVLPDIDNTHEFMGETFFTCFDCDGYHMTDKHVCIIGNGDSSARTALAVSQTYTEKVTLCTGKDDKVSPEYLGKLKKQNIAIIRKKAIHLNGREGKIESVEFEDGSSIKCDCVLSDLGYTRNDDFLSGIELKRSKTGYIEVDEHYESSQKGLFVVGPLNTGPDQVTVAVGEGAQAAMHIIKSGFDFD